MTDETRNKIDDKETAQAEFERFAEAMRIDLDIEDLDENDVRDLRIDQRVVIKSIMEGRIVIDEQGIATFFPEGCDSVTFRKAKTTAIIATDKKKQTAKMAQTLAILADLTGKPSTIFHKWDHADFKIASSVMNLFLV